MRPVFLLAAAATLVAAAPPYQFQYLDIAAINAFPSQAQGPAPTVIKQVPTHNPTVAAKKAASVAVSDPLQRRDFSARRAMLEKRGLIRRAGNCAPYPQGYAPSTSPDTVQAFLANPVYAALATNATTPSGYDRVFQDLNASVTQPGYMGVITYQHYNTIACQLACDAANGCTAFNIYIERDPSLDAGAGCPNPPAVFNYRCTLYGLNISATTATNVGQYRGPTDANGTAFQTAITASNGYVKYAPPPSYTNFTGPVALPGAIVVPEGADTYIGIRSWPGVYDPSQCAAACQATTAYDKQNLLVKSANGTVTYMPCNYFNSFVVSKNGVPQGTSCYFFSQPYSAQQATETIQYDQSGNEFTISSSYGFTLTAQDSGVVSD